VRIHLGDDWVAALPDPDRALFHVIAEASARPRARELVVRYAKLIEEWRKGP